MSDEQPKLALLPREKQTAQEIEKILQLPSDMWSSVEVYFATDQPATAKVEMILTATQLSALADTAARAAVRTLTRHDS